MVIANAKFTITPLFLKWQILNIFSTHILKLVTKIFSLSFGVFIFFVASVRCEELPFLRPPTLYT